MNIHDFFNGIGINPTVLLAGGFGGMLRALSRKQFKFREVVASPICGALAAAYLTMPFVHYVRISGWPLPTDEVQTILASAFVIGLSGMWIADLVFRAAAQWLGVKNEGD